jgi:hypothetical protein
MPISITISKATGLNVTFLNDTWDDATIDRFLVWAKANYSSAPDPITGIIPATTNTQACRRASRAWVQAMKDSIRRYESDIAHTAVPPAAPINDGNAS